MAILNANHTSLTMSADVAEICKPLFNELGLNYVCMVRIYNDGRRVVLTNASEWQQHYCKNEFYNTDSFALLPENYIDGYYSANLFKNTEVYVDATRHYSIEYLITIVDKNLTYCDIFHFGKDPAAQDVVYQTCLDNLEVLYAFKEFFKEKSLDLINASDVFGFKSDPAKVSPIFLEKNCHDKSEFMTAFPVKRYSFDSKFGSVYFTPREIECLKWLVKGKSAAEVGMLLSIPARTVEKHVTNMKDKLNCGKLSQVVYHVMSSPILKLLLVEDK